MDKEYLERKTSLERIIDDLNFYDCEGRNEVQDFGEQPQCLFDYEGDLLFMEGFEND